MKSKALSAQIAEYPHGRVPRALRRQQLLEEAYQLFVERGYHGASMDELARRVGVTKPVIYDLAGSKQALFREVMARVEADLVSAVSAAVAGHDDLAGRLHAGILAFLRFAQQRRKAWAALRSMESSGGEAAAMLRRGPVALVAALLGEGLGGGPRLDAGTLEILARAVNGAVEFVALWWQDHPEADPETLATLLADLLSPGLLALARPGPRRRRW